MIPEDRRFRVVFNCNVFARALINPKGPAGACLAAAQRGDVRPTVSDYILVEIRELPGKLKPKRGVTPERVELLIQDLAKYTTLAEDAPEAYVHPRDPDDSHYVNLALACRADRLITNDQHLLALMDPATPEGELFARRFPELKIVTPEDFLPELREWLATSR